MHRVASATAVRRAAAATGALACGPRPSQIAMVPATLTARRHRHFRMVVNLDDPEQWLADVRELKEKYLSEGKGDTAAYHQALIGVAMAHFGNHDFARARACAVYAHDTITESQGHNAYLCYFSALTVAECCKALAAQLEAELTHRDKHSLVAEARELNPRTPTVVGGAPPQEMMQRLLNEEAAHRLAARRVYNLPEHLHMREGPTSVHVSHNRRSRHAWDDTDCSTSAAAPGCETARAKAERAARRVRPEHAEVRRAKTQVNSASRKETMAPR